MKKVAATKVATASELAESPLPPQIQEALGELVGAAKEGLLALSVGVGLGVVHELMEAEVSEVGRPEGPPRRGAQRDSSRPRGRLGDARRTPGRSPSSARAQRRR